MPNEADPRYDRTEADLMEAFLILSRKKQPHSISVQEITRLAGVTRTTFYNHYVDMPTFVGAAEDRILEDVLAMMKSFRPEGQEEISRMFFRSLCAYIRQNSFLVQVLASPQASDFIEKALLMFRRYVSTTLAETGHDSEDGFSYALSFGIGGVVGVLHKWALGHCAQPPEVISDYLTPLFLDGMRNYLK